MKLYYIWRHFLVPNPPKCNKKPDGSPTAGRRSKVLHTRIPRTRPFLTWALRIKIRILRIPLNLPIIIILLTIIDTLVVGILISTLQKPQRHRLPPHLLRLLLICHRLANAVLCTGLECRSIAVTQRIYFRLGP